MVLVGDIQAVAGASTWAPTDTKTRMLYQGNGLYKITLKNVPNGNYQYKVAIGGTWAENYGANAVSNGGNIALSVPNTEDVTFYYSDNTHIIVDTTTYVAIAPVLSGNNVPDYATMLDYNLTGVYSYKATLAKGNHDDLLITNGNNTVPVPQIDISDTTKDVNISYDAITGIVFNDTSTSKIDTSSLYFNSKDSNYKSIYGAVPTNSDVAFNLQSKKNDLTDAKLIILSGAGATVIDMHKNGTFSTDTSSQYDRWTAKYVPTIIGAYQFYFAVTNGSDVKAYGDDDGYYGPGVAGDLGKVGKYDMNVYDTNFKTPDWLKNAVIYQIFPDRFFDGDSSNNNADTFTRGNTLFEHVNKWDSIPEDPNIEYEKDSSGNIKKDADGKPIIDPNYKANVGDGTWNNDVYGGDLKGIQDKLSYLKSLGVNTLYLNPISEASSNHKYDTRDYSEVDPMLGHMEDFINLVAAAHNMGMHLILDGVFNHVSDESIYFDRYGKYIEAGKPIGAYQYWSRVYDYMNAYSGITQQNAENKIQSDLRVIGINDFHYKDWFIVKNEKDSTGYYKYNGWNGDSSLPEIQALNNSEYNVSSWAKDVLDGNNADSKYWLNKGSDGWRLDAADSVSDDTWKNFRPAVKSVNSDDVIIGEIWGDSSKYLLGNMFDSVMNYRFRGAVQEYVTGSANAVTAMNDLEKMREQYPKEAFETLMNIVDSHDTERIISDFDKIGSDKAVASTPSASALAKMKLVPLIQMTYPGAPTIYYGDELGTPGGADPDCRRTMAWGEGNQSLVDWYAKLTNIRNSYSVLRTGDIVPLQLASAYSSDVLAYTRNDSSNHAVVVANRRTTDISGLQLTVSDIPNGTVLTNALDESKKYTVEDGIVTVDLPAQSGVILMAKYTAVTIEEAGLKDAYDPSFGVKDNVNAEVAVKNVTIDASKALTVGGTATLTANITPSNATVKTVTWSSSNENVAKVYSNGVVMAIAAGTADIVATTVDGQFVSKCKVTVINTTPSDNQPGTSAEVNNNSSDIVSLINNSKVTSIQVNASNNPVVAQEVFNQIKGKDKEITFVANNVIWAFNGRDITGDIPSSLNLSLKTVDTDLLNKEEAKVKAVAGNGATIAPFSFNYDGTLPGMANITLSLDARFANKKVNIYRYLPITDTYELAYQATADGNGSLTITLNHCSDYFATESTLPTSNINIGLKYEGHVQRLGWGYNSANGWQKDLTNTILDFSKLDVSNDKLSSSYEIIGTTGQSSRLEAIKLSLTGAVPAGASIQYQVHVQGEGWLAATSDEVMAGTTGKGKRIEAVAIKLIGLPGYEVQYKAHVQNKGWDTNWTTEKDSDTLGVAKGIAPSTFVGTTGKALRLEALAVRIVKVK